MMFGVEVFGVAVLEVADVFGDAIFCQLGEGKVIVVGHETVGKDGVELIETVYFFQNAELIPAGN